MNIYWRILKFTKPYGWQVVFHTLFAIIAVFATGIALSLLDPVLNLLFTEKKSPSSLNTEQFSLKFNEIFNQYIAGIIEEQGKVQALAISIGFIVGINLIGNVFKYLSAIFMAIIRTGVIRDIRTRLFEVIKSLPVGYFEEERKGNIISRMTSDVNEVEKSVVVTFQSLIRAPITILFFLFLMFSYSWKLTLFIFAVLPITALIITTLAKSLRKDAYNTQDMMAWIMSVLDEVISGVKIIKAFNAEKYIAKVFGSYNEKYSHHLKRQFYKQRLVPPFSEAMGVITVGLILWFGGQLVFEGELRASGFLVYIFYFQQIMNPAKNISNAFGNIYRGIASGERIFNVMDAPGTKKEQHGGKPLDDFKASIEFDGVSFSYSKDRVLKDVNLKIPKGKAYALVGPSGSGKTTMAEMIPRFYEATEGNLYIDDIDARDYDLFSLRKQIGLVTQDPILFNDTIFKNIAFGMEEVTEEQVIEAAKSANAHDFIVECDEGYQTFIGDRGVLLSGGQRQRLSIARAILKNPPIMILDEATSALDTSSEKIVQEALSRLMRNRTTVIIAHRLSTIQEADEIVVLEKGNIVQVGSHAELIEQEGLYRHLYELQQLAE